jgi:hypothetical protein
MGMACTISDALQQIQFHTTVSHFDKSPLVIALTIRFGSGTRPSSQLQMARVSVSMRPSSSSSAGTRPNGFFCRKAALRCWPCSRSNDSNSTSVMPFSARNIATRRGFGARGAEYSFI